MEKLDTNLFGLNNRPLCEYLDPGCPVLRFERLKQQLLNDVCPKTFALAYIFGNQSWRRDVWGMESDDGSFFTISTGSGKKGARPFGW